MQIYHWASFSQDFQDQENCDTGTSNHCKMISFLPKRDDQIEFNDDNTPIEHPQTIDSLLKAENPISLMRDDQFSCQGCKSDQFSIMSDTLSLGNISGRQENMIFAIEDDCF